MGVDVNKSEQRMNDSLNNLKPVISVVLSFRNEEGTIPELIKRLRCVLEKEYMNKFELIFVNDASTDNSEKILLEAAKGHNDIRIITTSRAFGVSECALAGMEFSSGDAVIYLDADLQDPPEVIPELINAWKSGNDIDIVHTVRLSRAGEPRIKIWLTDIGYKIIKYVSDINLEIEAGDFKLLSRRAVNQVIKLKEKKPYLRGLVTWIGFNQTIVYYRREARFRGQTKFRFYGYRVMQNYLNSALISFSDLPLKLSLISGGVITFFAIIALIFALLEKFLYQTTLGWWTATIIAMLFLGGLQLITIGILGLYITSIYLETKRRPNYIIKNVFGFDNSAEINSMKKEMECPYLCRYQHAENIFPNERDSDGIKDLK
jgi:dolichol-phosphate mannosyltransferase